MHSKYSLNDYVYVIDENIYRGKITSIIYGEDFNEALYTIKNLKTNEIKKYKESYIDINKKNAMIGRIKYLKEKINSSIEEINELILKLIGEDKNE